MKKLISIVFLIFFLTAGVASAIPDPYSMKYDYSQAGALSDSTKNILNGKDNLSQLTNEEISAIPEQELAALRTEEQIQYTMEEEGISREEAIATNESFQKQQEANLKRTEEAIAALDKEANTIGGFTQGVVYGTVNNITGAVADLTGDESLRTDLKQKSDEMLSGCNKDDSSFKKTLLSYVGGGGGDFCWFCGMFEGLFDAMNNLATAISVKMADVFLMIMGVGLLFSISFKVAKMVTSLQGADLMQFLTDLFKHLGRAIIATALLVSSLSIFTYLVSPVLTMSMSMSSVIMDEGGGRGAVIKATQATGIKVGSICDDLAEQMKVTPSVENQKKAFTPDVKASFICALRTMSAGLIFGVVLGVVIYALAYADKILGVLPNIQYILLGIIIVIGHLAILITFPFKLIDSMIRMAFVTALMPLWIILWVFPATVGYTKKAWDLFLSSCLIFVCLSVVITLVMTIMQYAIPNREEIISLLLCGQDVEAANKIPIGGKELLVTAALTFLGWKMLGTATTLASSFVGAIPDLGIGQSINETTVKGAKLAGKGARATGRWAGQKVGVDAKSAAKYGSILGVGGLLTGGAVPLAYGAWKAGQGAYYGTKAALNKFRGGSNDGSADNTGGTPPPPPPPGGSGSLTGAPNTPPPPPPSTSDNDTSTQSQGDTTQSNASSASTQNAGNETNASAQNAGNGSNAPMPNVPAGQSNSARFASGEGNTAGGTQGTSGTSQTSTPADKLSYSNQDTSQTSSNQGTSQSTGFSSSWSDSSLAAGSRPSDVSRSEATGKPLTTAGSASGHDGGEVTFTNAKATSSSGVEYHANGDVRIPLPADGVHSEFDPGSRGSESETGSSNTGADQNGQGGSGGGSGNGGQGGEGGQGGGTVDPVARAMAERASAQATEAAIQARTAKEAADKNVSEIKAASETAKTAQSKSNEASMRASNAQTTAGQALSEASKNNKDDDKKNKPE